MVTAEFLLTSMIVILMPGSGVLFTVSAGLTGGARASFFASVGCTAGILPHILATILGLAALLHMSAVAFQLLKFAGAIYLLYLAYSTWKDRGAFVRDDTTLPAASVTIAGRAFLVNTLNPKLTIFFLAFLPQFIKTGTAPLPQLLVMSGIFMALTFAVFVAYGFLAHLFRKAVVESPRVQSWLRCGFTAVFAGLGIRLAFTDR